MTLPIIAGCGIKRKKKVSSNYMLVPSGTVIQLAEDIRFLCDHDIITFMSSNLMNGTDNLHQWNYEIFHNFYISFGYKLKEDITNHVVKSNCSVFNNIQLYSFNWLSRKRFWYFEIKLSFWGCVGFFLFISKYLLVPTFIDDDKKKTKWKEKFVTLNVIFRKCQENDKEIMENIIILVLQ